MKNTSSTHGKSCRKSPKIIHRLYFQKEPLDIGFWDFATCSSCFVIHMCEKIETSKHLLFSFFIVLYTIVQKTPLMPKATWQHVPMQLYRVSQKVWCSHLKLPRVRCNSRTLKKSPNQTSPNLRGVGGKLGEYWGRNFLATLQSIEYL